MRRALIYLDRDGTINEDLGYVARIEQWRFLPGAVEGLQTLQQHGYRLAVVTNQSGIARGMFTEQDVHALHDFMLRELAKHDVVIDAVAICPHGPDNGCRCRKPAPGLADIVQETVDFSIDRRQSWMIGDKASDIDFGRAIGVQTAVLTSRYWTADSAPAADLQATSLLEAARQIVVRS